MGAGSASPPLTNCSCHANNLISLGDHPFLTSDEGEDEGGDDVTDDDTDDGKQGTWGQ